MMLPGTTRSRGLEARASARRVDGHARDSSRGMRGTSRLGVGFGLLGSRLGSGRLGRIFLGHGGAGINQREQRVGWHQSGKNAKN